MKMRLYKLEFPDRFKGFIKAESKKLALGKFKRGLRTETYDEIVEDERFSMIEILTVEELMECVEDDEFSFVEDFSF